MAIKLKLVDVTKLKQSSYLVSQVSTKVVSEAKIMLDKQEQFMKEGGMDRKKLRAFINSDLWTDRQKQKAREELINFHSELKNNVAIEVENKRRELSAASRLLNQNRVTKAVSHKKKTGFL